MTLFKAIHPVKIRDFIYSLVGLVKGLHVLCETVKSFIEWVQELGRLPPFEF